MLKWLRRHSHAKSSAHVERQLHELDEQAAAAADSQRGSLFNRAGDLCAAEGLVRRALVYYGRAVDVYLAAGYLGPAAALCSKIMRHSPDAVRAHCTLACLAAHGQQTREMKAEIRHLVDASRRTHTERLTIARLRLLADAVADGEVKRYIAVQLHDLGDVLGSQRITAALLPPRPRLHDDAAADGARWEKLVLAAALDPDELWKYS